MHKPNRFQRRQETKRAAQRHNSGGTSRSFNFAEDWHQEGQERERQSVCLELDRITMFAHPTFADQQQVEAGSEAEMQDLRYLTERCMPVCTTPSGVKLYR